MEGFEFAINFLTDQVLFKKANPTVRSLSVYIMRELAKNYVFGRSEKWVDHVKELMNVKNRQGQAEGPIRGNGDPVDEYYLNM
jgi:hypothetical protein